MAGQTISHRRVVIITTIDRHRLSTLNPDLRRLLTAAALIVTAPMMVVQWITSTHIDRWDRQVTTVLTTTEAIPKSLNTSDQGRNRHGQCIPILLMTADLPLLRRYLTSHQATMIVQIHLTGHCPSPSLLHKASDMEAVIMSRFHHGRFKVQATRTASLCQMIVISRPITTQPTSTRSRRVALFPTSSVRTTTGARMVALTARQADRFHIDRNSTTGGCATKLNERMDQGSLTISSLGPWRRIAFTTDMAVQ